MYSEDQVGRKIKEFQKSEFVVINSNYGLKIVTILLW